MSVLHMKLSASMWAALHLAANGGLVRFPGGFWISGNVKATGDQHGVPVDEEGQKVPHVGTLTIRSLEKRDLLEPDPAHDAVSWRRRRILTAKGQDVEKSEVSG